jgi:hypothetical protein
MLRTWTLAALFMALPTIALAQVQSGEPRSGVRSGEPLSGVRGGSGVGLGSGTSGSGASGSGVSSPDQFISTPGGFGPNTSFTPNTANTPNTPFTPNSGGR